MKRGKKLNQSILSVRDFEGGVEGAVGEITQMTGYDGDPLVSKTYGTPLFTFDLADLNSGEIKKFWADGGIRGAFKMSKVKPGDKIAIEHTGTQKLEQGTVQTYDVFRME